MTNNTDEFDQEQFDTMGSEDSYGQQAAPKQSLFETIKNKPIVKLLVIMGFVGVALAGSLGSFSSRPEEDPSVVKKPPSLNEAPGGSATPFFREQNEKANAERVGHALNEGGSALPTPVGHDVSDLTDKRKDPLVEFKAETDRLRNELIMQQKQNNQQLQLMQRQLQQGRAATADDDSLAKAMQKQMQQLMEGWTPRQAKFVNGYPAEEPKTDKTARQGLGENRAAEGPQANGAAMEKVIVTAGTVNYAQLLTEANSDVPGPILAQILSGPLSGGRAIGSFKVMNDYLVLTFNLVTYKGKDYAVNALALDPDTTLGGMATEVDHRYFTRVLLPAAASFAQAFGQALSETETETTVSDGTVVSDQAKKGMKEALYSGMGEMGETLGEFFRNEANNTKTLVRVGVGTPMGVFFLQSVKDVGAQSLSQEDYANQLLRGYQQMGVGMTSSPSYAPRQQYGAGTTAYDQAVQQALSSGSLTPEQARMIKSMTSSR